MDFDLFVSGLVWIIAALYRLATDNKHFWTNLMMVLWILCGMYFIYFSVL